MLILIIAIVYYNILVFFNAKMTIRWCQLFIQGLEKNKLFVKDLSRDTSQERLEQIFGEYGTLKEVRLITYRNGHSKGLAFVEFEDEASAAKALVTIDGKMILQFWFIVVKVDYRFRLFAPNFPTYFL